MRAARYFAAVDSHTEGMPTRVITGGIGPIPGATMLERKLHFEEHLDELRQLLMREPRGHGAMSGAILQPPTRDDTDWGVVFIEVSGCLPMCGHGTIGTVTIAIEEGLVRPREPGKLAIEAPAGRVAIEYTQSNGHVEQVRLFNIPSYLHAENVEIEMPDLGPLTIDVAYGGNYYAIIEPQKNWGGLDGMPVSELIRLSPLVRRAAQEKVAPVHPEDNRIRGVTHIQWCDKPRNARANARNAVFYGDKAIDRSPCGTGSSARLAQLAAKGRLKAGDNFVHESIIGTMFDCRVESEANVGNYRAIRPSVAGWAQVTGHNTIFVDDRDPLAHGFQVM